MDHRKIVVLGTGGTIAGTSEAPGDNIGYTAGQVGVEALLEGVMGGLRAARGALLHSEQVAQIDSKDMDPEVWLRLARRCRQHLLDPQVIGVVVTHGTDTLEETAWFLHEVLDVRAKPVVLTCAMRPASALAPDGPQNLLDAIAVAATPGARGVLAVAAGEVHGARQVHKAHPYRIHALTSGEAGPLGWVEEGALRLALDWPQPLSGIGFEAIENITDAGGWPWVEIVHSHAGATGTVVDMLVRAGVRGLVVAATGNGTVHQALEAALLRAQHAGVSVLRSTRCELGRVLPRPGDALPDSGGLSPVKARISLALGLISPAR